MQDLIMSTDSMKLKSDFYNLTKYLEILQTFSNGSLTLFWNWFLLLVNSNT